MISVLRQKRRQWSIGRERKNQKGFFLTIFLTFCLFDDDCLQMIVPLNKSKPRCVNLLINIIWRQPDTCIDKHERRKNFQSLPSGQSARSKYEKTITYVKSLGCNVSIHHHLMSIDLQFIHTVTFNLFVRLPLPRPLFLSLSFALSIDV